MNKAEIAKMLAFITALYPNIQVKQGTVEAWHEMIGDIPYAIGKEALKKVLAEQQIPALPTIGKIREAALYLKNPNILSPAEAWSQANAALDKYGYYRADEGMAVLPPAIKKTIRALGGFESICTTENIETVRAQFLRMYDQFAKSERENALLPESVRQFIAGAVKELPGAVGQ